MYSYIYDFLKISSVVLEIFQFWAVIAHKVLTYVIFHAFWLNYHLMLQKWGFHPNMWQATLVWAY